MLLSCSLLHHHHSALVNIPASTWISEGCFSHSNPFPDTSIFNAKLSEIGKLKCEINYYPKDFPLSVDREWIKTFVQIRKSRKPSPCDADLFQKLKLHFNLNVTHKASQSDTPNGGKLKNSMLYSICQSPYIYACAFPSSFSSSSILLEQFLDWCH